jgi:hypothetical protein
MSRSLPLTLDTNHASIVMVEQTHDTVRYSTTTATIRTTMLPSLRLQNTKLTKSSILSRKLSIPDFEGLRKFESLLASAKTTSSTPGAAPSPSSFTSSSSYASSSRNSHTSSSKFETNNNNKNINLNNNNHHSLNIHNQNDRLDDYVWNIYDKKPLDIIVYSTTFLVLSIVLVVLLIVLIVKMRKSRSDNDKMILIDHEVTSNLNTTCGQQTLHV